MDGPEFRHVQFAGFARDSAAALWRTALALTADRGLAEELVQEALTSVFVRWDRIEDPLAYARRSLVNGLRSEWRRHRSHKVVPIAEVFDGWSLDEPDHAGAVSQRMLLLEALASLPAGRRAVVVLRHVEDLSEAETAEVLGVGVGTVKRQNARGLEQLRAWLLAHDHAAEIPGGVWEESGPASGAAAGPRGRRPPTAPQAGPRVVELIA